MLRFKETTLKGNFVIEPEPFSDDRGWFTRYFCLDEFKTIGHTASWVQMNHSFTSAKGTIRGMHYQLPPYSEIKFLKCISGAVYDVIIDLRADSPTFLQWFGEELSAANKKMMYIPEGFAHGFQTLEDNSELIYHHSAFYTPGYEDGIRYNDPAVAISWPLQVTKISERDSNFKLLNKDFTGINIKK